MMTHDAHKRSGESCCGRSAVFVVAYQDTKTLQENEQLKAQVADLQRENSQLGNNLETVTAARDALAK